VSAGDKVLAAFAPVPLLRCSQTQPKKNETVKTSFTDFEGIEGGQSSYAVREAAKALCI
jgi:hypothetical protein